MANSKEGTFQKGHILNRAHSKKSTSEKGTFQKECISKKAESKKSTF